MSYTRTTVIDAGPSGDSVKQAVLDLDADLTGAFTAINAVADSVTSLETTVSGLSTFNPVANAVFG